MTEQKARSVRDDRFTPYLTCDCGHANFRIPLLADDSLLVICNQCGGTAMQIVTWEEPGGDEGLPNEGHAVDGVTEEGEAGRDAAAPSPRDGADSHDVGLRASEVNPADEKGGRDESHVPPAPRRGVTADPDDPRLGRGVDTAPVPQHDVYLVLSDAELAQGFVRPVRTSYVHTTCGSVTTMGQTIAETYARQPSFYGATYCVRCGMHRPVGADGEFVWDDGSGQRVGT